MCATLGGDRHLGGRGHRQNGIGELAVYRWRKQDSGMGVVGLCRLRQIKEVNIKLKPPTVDLSSD